MDSTIEEVLLCIKVKKLNKLILKRDTKRIIKYTREQLQKDDVTEDEIRLCKNDYYKKYRKAHSTAVKKNMDDFWKRKAEEQDALRKEFLQSEE